MAIYVSQLHSGISSLCFTNFGEALYMMSSSEIQRISLSGSKIVMPTGHIELEDWDSEDDKEEKTEDGDENTTAEATTPTTAENGDVSEKHKGREEIKENWVIIVINALIDSLIRLNQRRLIARQEHCQRNNYNDKFDRLRR